MRGGVRQSPTSSRPAADWGAYLDLIGIAGRLLAGVGVPEKRLRGTILFSPALGVPPGMTPLGRPKDGPRDGPRDGLSMPGHHHPTDWQSPKLS